MCVIDYEYDYVSSRDVRLKRRCHHVYREVNKKDTKLNPRKARRKTRFDNK